MTSQMTQLAFGFRDYVLCTRCVFKTTLPPEPTKMANSRISFENELDELFVNGGSQFSTSLRVSHTRYMSEEIRWLP